jgi:hypothetical protein
MGGEMCETLNIFAAFSRLLEYRFLQADKKIKEKLKNANKGTAHLCVILT